MKELLKYFQNLLKVRAQLRNWGIYIRYRPKMRYKFYQQILWFHGVNKIPYHLTKDSINALLEISKPPQNILQELTDALILVQNIKHHIIVFWDIHKNIHELKEDLYKPLSNFSSKLHQRNLHSLYPYEKGKFNKFSFYSPMGDWSLITIILITKY